MKSVVILVDFETTVPIHFIKKHVKILEQDTLLTWNLKIEDYKCRNIYLEIEELDILNIIKQIIQQNTKIFVTDNGN